MAIKFICGCGKHLRAREELASLRTLCPVCGAWVGVPSLQASQRGAAAGPMTPEERRQARRRAELAELAPSFSAAITPMPSDTPQIAEQPAPGVANLDVSIRLLPSKKFRLPRLRRDARDSGTILVDNLAYLVRRSSVLFGLVVALIALSRGAILLPPYLRESPPQSVFLQILLAIALLAVLAVPACVFGFLEHALAYASAGTRRFRWVGLLRAARNWSLAFLAGPSLFAGAAAYFALHCGDPNAVDRLILLELTFLAAVYWLLAVLSVHWHGSLRGLDPARLVDLARQLRGRIVLLAPAAIAMLVFGRGIFLALEKLHGDAQLAFAGWLMLAGCWFGVLASGLLSFLIHGAWLATLEPTDGRPRG